MHSSCCDKQNFLIRGCVKVWLQNSIAFKSTVCRNNRLSFPCACYSNVRSEAYYGINHRSRKTMRLISNAMRYDERKL